jgi:hypothetical protein
MTISKGCSAKFTDAEILQACQLVTHTHISHPLSPHAAVDTLAAACCLLGYVCPRRLLPRLAMSMFFVFTVDFQSDATFYNSHLASRE